MLLHDLLRRSAERAPDTVALCDASGPISWGMLHQRANQAAQALRAQGVKRGDRVVLALENSIEFVGWYFGILKAGAIVVPLARGPRSDRLACAVSDCTPVVCVTDSATARTLSDAFPQSSLRVLIVRHATPDVRFLGRPGLPVVDAGEALAAGPADDPQVRMIDVDLAAIVYTSGSVGTPRGVMLSHLNLTANAESIVAYLGLTSADRVMAVLPFHYIYGLSLLHTHVCVGGSVVIDNRFAFPNVVLKAMQSQAVTGFAGVPSTFALLLRHSGIAGMSFPALRYVTQAGGPMSPARIREWRALLPDVSFYVMYGATEAAARLAYLDPADLDRAPGSIGRAIPNVELLVMKEDGTIAPPGEVGEIVARGSNISPGYWGSPEATHAAFGPQGYRTGDLAVTDADGYLYVVGRRHEMLKVGGHRVGPKEIEDVLNRHHGVHEAAVVGTPDALLGEVPMAFTVPREDAAIDEAELLAFCRRRLPDYKVPARIVTTTDLPRSEAGKIDKHALRLAAARLRARPQDEDLPVASNRGR
jgi:acyl-CoA synthetase (AMP-forming)/AMP-acid ligase II